MDFLVLFVVFLIFQKTMKNNFQDLFLSCKNCVLENPRSFYGSFALGPFRNSQSLTVANALRRTLLTEIPAIAITHVEIQGVHHEYSTLPGVRESTLDLLLNLKTLVLKTFSPLKKPVFGYLNVRGPGIVRAGDLKLPPSIKCVDPDQYISTLTENGNLTLKFTICDSATSLKILHASESNSDQESQEKNQLKYWTNSEKKFLWVDPLFHPITKVNYSIETLEPFQKNVPNEILYLELWTNGSIHPRQAFYESLLYLKTMFTKLDSMRLLNYNFTNLFLSSEKTTTKYVQQFVTDFSSYNSLSEKKEKNASKLLPSEIQTVEKDFLENIGSVEKTASAEFPLQKFQLPIRILKVLEKNKICFLGDLLKYSSDDLKKFPGIGKSTIFIIENSLQQIGMKLASFPKV